ncbi:hypothetical protein F5050DRAFT_1543935, partial [Lentinula boryana]
FQCDHPQYLTHCLKHITMDELPRVPVLIGYPIPRNDREDEKEKYALAMLALFKPWSNIECKLLKEGSVLWSEAFSGWINAEDCPSVVFINTMKNMQLLHLSKDAKLDYAAMRRK